MQTVTPLATEQEGETSNDCDHPALKRWTRVVLAGRDGPYYCCCCGCVAVESDNNHDSDHACTEGGGHCTAQHSVAFVVVEY
jgi:hypothetical protein